MPLHPTYKPGPTDNRYQASSSRSQLADERFREGSGIQWNGYRVNAGRQNGRDGSRPGAGPGEGRWAVSYSRNKISFGQWGGPEVGVEGGSGGGGGGGGAV